MNEIRELARTIDYDAFALEITHALCHEHHELWEVDADDTFEFEDEVRCPVDAGCAVYPVHVSEEPATASDYCNRDYYHHGRKRYEYTLEVF